MRSLTLQEVVFTLALQGALLVLYVKQRRISLFYFIFNLRWVNGLGL